MVPLGFSFTCVCTDMHRVHTCARYLGFSHLLGVLCVREHCHHLVQLILPCLARSRRLTRVITPAFFLRQ